MHFKMYEEEEDKIYMTRLLKNCIFQAPIVPGYLKFLLISLVLKPCGVNSEQKQAPFLSPLRDVK